jgi:hypothetical protein
VLTDAGLAAQEVARQVVEASAGANVVPQG